MPIYNYKAKLKNAETVLGEVEAQTKQEAVDKINQMGLTAVHVAEAGHANVEKAAAAVRPRRISSKELYLFSRQLANLTRSGIPILRTLELIGNQNKNSYFKYVIENIRAGVREGRNFSDCLAEYPKIFSNLYVVMVKAGEESGNLKETVSDMANYLQEQEEIASKVRSAAAYPIFMLLFGIGTLIYMLTGVLPKITEIFSNFNQELPVPTQIVIAISDFLIHQWMWVVLAVVLLVAAVLQWDKTKSGRLYKSQVKLHLPLFGPFWLKAELARFCRTLQLLLKSGIPIVRAIQLSIPIVENDVIQAELQKCQDDLLAGRSLGLSLKDAKYVPPMLGDLIIVGEESGSLSSTLNDISRTYEQETNETIKLMTTLIEPAMILLVGSMLGMIVIAMLLPIFQLDVFAR